MPHDEALYVLRCMVLQEQQHGKIPVYRDAAISEFL
jgi:hypothetical protein